MTDDLTALRRRITDLQAERARVAAAPPPERDALAGIEAEIARLAASLGPVTAGSLDALARIRPAALLAALLPGETARLIAEGVRAGYAGGAKPMALGARARRLAELDAELLARETDEERLIRVAEACGEPIDRRADASPAAVLAQLSEEPT